MSSINKASRWESLKHRIQFYRRPGAPPTSFHPRRPDDPRMLGVIADRRRQAEAWLALDQGADGLLLVGADLQDQVAAGLQQGDGLFDQARDHVEAAGPPSRAGCGS